MTTTTTNTAAPVEEVNGIKVFTQIQRIPLKDIKENYWNPNFCSAAIQRAIEDDIRKNGFIDPIILQKHNKKTGQDNMIINGEHRFRIFKKIIGDALVNAGTPIPCTIIDCNDKTAMALTIRLNREHGELMPDKIGKIAMELSPKRDLNYLHNVLFLEKDEIHLLTDISNKLGKEKPNQELDNSSQFLERTEQEAEDVANSPADNKEALVLRGILKVECPSCHAIIDVPR